LQSPINSPETLFESTSLFISVLRRLVKSLALKVQWIIWGNMKRSPPLMTVMMLMLFWHSSRLCLRASPLWKCFHWHWKQ